MEEKVKRVRVYSEEERERRREAERKRMEDPEYRAAKRVKDRLRMENKEVRERKRAMDRERNKLADVAARKLEAARKYRLTEKGKETFKKLAYGERIKWIADNVGKVCPVVVVKCLDCGCVETKKAYRVKDGKASSRYCSIHAKNHRHTCGVDYKHFDIICADCGVECVGVGRSKKVCSACSKERAKALKKTNEAKAAKKMLGLGLRQRARRKGCYVDTVRPNTVFERDKWRCVGCGNKVVRSRYWQPNQATVDHRIPLSRGGSHTYENCQTMCMTCNSKKEASMPTGVQLTVFDRVA